MLTGQKTELAIHPSEIMKKEKYLKKLSPNVEGYHGKKCARHTVNTYLHTSRS